MRPQLHKVSREPGHSFTVKRYLGPDISDRWHFHAEVELIHFREGQGTLAVGDCIREFKAGDVVLVGAHLPHYWRVLPEDTTDVRTVHFDEFFWGDSFLGLPENVPLKSLLERAKRGLQAEGGAKRAVAILLERLLEAAGMRRLLLLLEILQVLAGRDRLEPLASVGFRLPEAGHERVDLVYAYSLRHFRRAIQLEEIAAVANISPNSFCRFFKSRTGKTYSRLLLELRVGHACKLLIENSLSIKQISCGSGFNNFTSFYKYFKLITGRSPVGYQRELAEGSIEKGRRRKRRV